MKKLRIILQSNLFISFLCLITLLYIIITVFNCNYKSKYSINTSSVTGILLAKKIDGNKVSLDIKGKEKIIVNYYMQNKNEMELFDSYELGDKLRIEGKLLIPNINTNFHLFNYRKFLFSKKVYWTMSANKVQLIGKNHNLGYYIKNEIRKRIQSIGNTYLFTFILGDNSQLDNDVISSYQTNSISHLFALSGMHVGLITTFLIFLLKKISKRKWINHLIISLFLLFYVFLTNYSPSIIRCALFFILLLINDKRIGTLKLYIIFTCIILLINPYYIYNVSFQFSYSITLYLIIYGKYFNSINNYFIKILSLSFISFLVSIPIMINNYFTINIIGFIFNIFYVPLVSFIVLPLSFLTFFFPIFNGLLIFFTNILETSSSMLSKITFGQIIMHHVNIYVIIFYYLIISVVIHQFTRKKYKFILILIIPLCIHANINYFNKYSAVTFIDVGQGDCILISLPRNNENILIDTGGKVTFEQEEWKKRKKTYSISNSTIIPYLKSIGINKLDSLILSHGDYDHMGETINLVNNFKVEKVIFNCGPYNDLEKELIKVLDKKKIPYYSCIKELNIDNNKLYFLQTKEYDNENDNSNVIYTKIKGYKFIFMGDASITTEKEIINKYNLHDIDVLKVGHHGSKTSSSKEFINEINPKYSIISVGKNNRYGHPNKEVLNNLKESKVYRTDEDGSIMFKIKNNKLKIETCAP